jgi:hypothetical protein
MELTENGNIRFFSSNGKRKRQTSICLLQNENVKWKFVFLGLANDIRQSTIVV